MEFLPSSCSSSLNTSPTCTVHISEPSQIELRVNHDTMNHKGPYGAVQPTQHFTMLKEDEWIPLEEVADLMCNSVTL